MRIALACAGQRGYHFLRRLRALKPAADLAVFSFRETAHEPPFLDAIREFTLSQGGLFVETRRMDGPEGLQIWDAVDVDLLLVVGWRYLISERAYARPRRGTFVIHDSLLPRYRGFSPTVWAIRNGEDHTGATLFRIAQQVDHGDVVDQVKVPIGPEDTIAEVMERVTHAYLALLERQLDALLHGAAVCRPQQHSQATYFGKRGIEDIEIDWSKSAGHIHNLVRAVTAPYPGAFTWLGGRRLRIWSARPWSYELHSGTLPGQIVGIRPREGAVVCTGQGSLLVREVQWHGEPASCASVALAGITPLHGKEPTFARGRAA